MVGKTLGHYEILEPLGKGGMGEVYRARDTKLERHVAIKVLPEDFATDQDRLARFEREAKLLASLNHANIATIHGLEDADGVRFIAMELVEGETLAECIARQGRIEVEESLEIARQIAEALEAAHESGVIHRDLKPANVKVTRDGKVKVLDFGLAKAYRAEGDAEGDLTRSPTITVEGTKTGVIQGTAAYMSPEQARGKPLDKRTDIFSFGCVLYEVLTGRRPFVGEDVSETMAAILRDEPDWNALPAATPLAAQALLRRCLRKDPNRRLHDIADARIEIEEALSEPSEALPSAARVAAEPPLWQRAIPWVIAFLAVAAMVAYWALPRILPPGETARPALNPVFLTALPGTEVYPALSPTGTQVAFLWDGGEQGAVLQLHVMLVDAGVPLPRTSEPGGVWGKPAWSPDGSEIAFLRKKDGDAYDVLVTSALAGPERPLGSILSNYYPGLSWSPDGSFLALSHKGTPEERHAIYLLSTGTGDMERLTSPPGDTSVDWDDRHPAFSPDGQTLAFVRRTSFTARSIYLVPVSGGGQPERLTDDLAGISDLDWLADGAALVFAASPEGIAGLWRISRSGGGPNKLPFGENATAVSVAGNRLVYSRGRADINIWRVEGPASIEPPTPSPFITSITSTLADREAIYSPLGDEIALSSNRTGQYQIWICDADGANCRPLTSESGWNPRWSPDGSKIAYTCGVAENRPDICVIDAAGGFPEQRTHDSQAALPSWSQDGRWIYFVSPSSGVAQVWKVPAEGGAPQQVTHGGGIRAQESEDGLVYYSKRPRPRNSAIWRVPAEGGTEELVLDKEPDYMKWALWEQSIVYINPEGEEGPTLERFDLTTRTVHEIATLPPKGQMTEATDRFEEVLGGLSVSADGKWVLYAQRDLSGSDLMLVENFR